MKVVYSAANLALVGYVKGVLEDSGIPCRMRNEFLSGVAGELPPIECWPQVVIDDHSLEERAREIVEELMSAADRAGAPWRCRGCGETIEAQFTDCWNCGRGMPGVVAD